MEAPGDDELEWMAMEQQKPDDEVEDLFNEMHPDMFEEVLPQQGFEEPQHGDAFQTGDASDVSDEDVELLDSLEPESEPPVKRKRLVFPDMSLSPIKSRKVHVEPSTNTQGRNDAERGDHDEITFLSKKRAEPQDDNSKKPHKRAADIPGDFIPITGPCGERVYAEVKQQSGAEHILLTRSEGPLLPESVEKILERVEHEQFEQICNASAGKDGDKEPSMISAMAKLDQLWVDKYAPTSFTELLSDERINREVLSWLKQWDPCVYGGKRHSTSNEVLIALRHRVQHISDAKTIRRKTVSLQDGSKGTESDRPDQKVLLLCGPPGLGKTTLAHVAAKHCGYRIVEINASDDRTVSSFQGKILDAVQMKPVMGDSKPNCLIIDEIDGAFNGMEGKGAINSLLELISAEPKAGCEKENEPRDTKSHKKKTNIRRLSRPVICICNDLYAPALRPLRPAARVYIFAPPSTHRIVTRLKFICKMEGYKVNPRALTALAVHTECDIRSCLNTLQFLHRKAQALKTFDIGSQVIGRKDMTSSMFDIWVETFLKRKSKLGAMNTIKGSNQEQRDFSRLHDIFANHGDYNLVIEGIHENLLHIHYHDSYLQKTIECLDLIGQSDILGHRTISQQQYFLNAYRPAIKMAIRRLVAQPTRPSLEWPKSFQRHRQQFTTNMEILRSWLNSVSPALLRSVSCACLVQDVMSPMLSILAPNLRPVASHLLSHQEIEDVKQLVDTMIVYGIRYKQSKAGSSTEYKIDTFAGFSLDPPLYSFINFKDYVHNHPQLSSTMQQMLSHEIEMEAIKRESASRAARTCVDNAVMPKDQLPVSKQIQQNISSACHKTVEVSTPEKHSKLSQKTGVSISSGGLSFAAKAKSSVKPVKSAGFFDRFRTGSVNRDKSSGEDKTVKRDSRPLLFKFHEGFTNAIKKPVLMRDLLA